MAFDDYESEYGPNSTPPKDEEEKPTSLLDSLLNVYKPAARSAGDAINKYASDVSTAAQPTGLVDDLLGFFKENVQNLGGQARTASQQLSDVATGKTTNLDNLLEIGRNIAASTSGSISEASKVVRPGEEFLSATRGIQKPNAPAIQPKVSALGQAVKSYLDDSLTDRDLGRGIIREEQGKITQRQAQESQPILPDLAKWYSRPKEEGINFIDHIETGDIGTIKDPSDKALAYELSNAMLRRRNDVIALEKKDGQDYFQSLVKDYFPHMWENPQEAKSVFDTIVAKRTASEGSQEFLRDRNVGTVAEGVALGLKPKSFNPVETALMKIGEMDRFLMAHNIKDRYVDSGLLIAGKEGVPPGWQKVNDPITGGKALYGPPDLVKDFNRYFSPGLMGNPTYDMLRGVSNNLTMAQLGLSGFHALFEGVESSVSDVALGLQQATQGKVGEALKSAGRASTVVGSPLRDIIAGDRMMKEYLSPGSYSKYAQEAKAIATSGGRIDMDPVYTGRAMGAWKEAIRDGNYPKAVAKSLPALLQWSSKPLMQWYVPRIKLGSFQKMAANVIEESQKGGWTEGMLRRELQKTWDSVDNRFGQLSYSNLFMHKVAKDLALVAVRAPGWNIGTWRELGGGVLDLTKESTRAIAEGHFNLSHRAAYTMALPIMAGYVGALTNLGLTGEWPKELKDYYFPRDGTKDNNGNPNRIQIPGYIKDVLHIANHPLKTVLGKLNPAITSTVDILNNKDFYNTEIRHPGDPLPNQAADLAKYLAESMTPFSIRNYKQRGGGVNGNSVGNLIQSLVGILPAPREYIRTPAENKMSEFLQRHTPSGPITKEEADQRNNRRELESSFRRDQIGVGDLVKAVGNGKITRQQLTSIVKFKNLPTIARDIKMLNADEAFEVFQAGNDKEKLVIQPEVRRILMRKMTSDSEHRQQWLDKLLKVGSSQKASIKDDSQDY